MRAPGVAAGAEDAVPKRVGAARTGYPKAVAALPRRPVCGVPASDTEPGDDRDVGCQALRFFTGRFAVVLRLAGRLRGALGVAIVATTSPETGSVTPSPRRGPPADDETRPGSRSSRDARPRDSGNSATRRPCRASARRS